MATFKDIVRETIVSFIKQGKKTISIDELKVFLLNNYDMRSLNYPSTERKIIQNFIEVARANGWIDFYDKTNFIRISQDFFDIISLKENKGDVNEKV